MVKGYDLGGGEYVILTPEELESVEPGRSRTIEITDFVDLGEIDPIHYKSTYYVGPQGEQAARPYALLRQAMEASSKVAIATLVLRSKEHLVAIRPTHSVLALETMYFADEVRDPAREVPGLDENLTFTPRELDTAKMLIESMTSPWDPEVYEDEYRKRVEQLIEEKRQGTVVVAERREPAPTPVVDLMEALQASVEAARAHKPGRRLTPATDEPPAPARTRAQDAHPRRGGPVGPQQGRAPGPGGGPRHRRALAHDQGRARGGAVRRRPPGEAAQGVVA